MMMGRLLAPEAETMATTMMMRVILMKCPAVMKTDSETRPGEVEEKQI